MRPGDLHLNKQQLGCLYAGGPVPRFDQPWWPFPQSHIRGLFLWAMNTSFSKRLQKKEKSFNPKLSKFSV